MSDKNINIPIIIHADLETTPLGQKSKLLDDLAGKTILRHTAARICKTRNASDRIIYCLPQYAEKIKETIAPLPIEVQTVNFELPKWWHGLQSARKWASACWRGGLLGAFAFDEDIVAAVLAELMTRKNAEAAIIVPAHAALIDPEILDNQIEHYFSHKDEMKISFTQAPPGLSGVILARELAQQLSQAARFAGQAIGYNPDSPKPDFINKPCNLELDPDIVKTPVRFTCDTHRAFRLAEKIAKKIDIQSASAKEITKIAKGESSESNEIEIELYSGWPYPKGLRPKSDKQPSPIDPSAIIKKISEAASEYDDLLVFIGGKGEPTKHPDLAKIVNEIKDAGAWGIGLHTTGIIEKETISLLAELPLDVINVLIDVPERKLYHELTGIDAYEKIIENIEQLTSTIRSRKQSTPLIIPEMVKTPDTMELMDNFFDTWIKKTGWAVIRKISH